MKVQRVRSDWRKKVFHKKLGFPNRNATTFVKRLSLSHNVGRCKGFSSNKGQKADPRRLMTSTTKESKERRINKKVTTMSIFYCLMSTTRGSFICCPRPIKYSFISKSIILVTVVLGLVVDRQTADPKGRGLTLAAFFLLLHFFCPPKIQNSIIQGLESGNVKKSTKVTAANALLSGLCLQLLQKLSSARKESFLNSNY